MTPFWFALCLVSAPQFLDYPWDFVSCQYVNEADCLMQHDRCFPGWVTTPKYRRSIE